MAKQCTFCLAQVLVCGSSPSQTIAAAAIFACMAFVLADVTAAWPLPGHQDQARASWESDMHSIDHLTIASCSGKFCWLILSMQSDVQSAFAVCKEGVDGQHCH